MLRAIVSLVLASGVLSIRADTILDFDSLSDLTAVTTQYAGVTFSNAMVLTAGVDLNEIDFPSHSGTNVVVDDGGPISITFSMGVHGFGGYFTYTEPLTIAAFDASQNLLGTVQSVFSNNTTSLGDVGSSPNEFLSITAQGSIAEILITGDPLGFSFTLDDATITTSVPSLAEPNSFSLLVMVLGGLALFGSRKTVTGALRG
jgi:hypothetical protein